MKGKILFAVTLIFASQLAFADGDEPFAVKNQKPSATSSGVTARPVAVENGKLDQKLDIVTKQQVGENAITALELSIIDQRKQLVYDKARLARIQVNMKNDAFWRNTTGTASAAFAVLAALSIRYGLKNGEGVGSFLGFVGAGAVSMSSGGTAIGYESDRRSAMAQAAGVSAAIQGRLDLISKTEARIKAIRGQALSR